jgi:hypothetical protein
VRYKVFCKSRYSERQKKKKKRDENTLKDIKMPNKKLKDIYALKNFFYHFIVLI